MIYSIGEVADIIGITSSALRYYDKEGLFPNIGRRNGGIRAFSDNDIDALKMVICLKSTGMPIKDIKQFIDWCIEGDNTLQERRDMFLERKENVEKQIAELQKTLQMVNYKCWYYETACKANTEQAPLNMPEDKIPEEIRRSKKYFAD